MKTKSGARRWDVVGVFGTVDGFPGGILRVSLDYVVDRFLFHD